MMRFPLLLLSLLFAAGSFGCGPDTLPPSAAPRTTIDWSACPDHAGLECGTVEVAADRRSIDGRTVEVALARLPATDPGRRIGSLVLHFGGPGSSGVGVLALAGRSLVPAEIAARFDLVAFDQRGVGATLPVDCFSDTELSRLLDEEVPPAAPGRDDLQAAWEAAQAFAAGCEALSGTERLKLVSTRATVDDLEAIRIALGDERLTFLGFSYGGMIGAVYADRYPSAVRAMVLDGAVEPGISFKTRLVEQALSFENALNRFLIDCDRRAACVIGADPQTTAATAFDALMERLRLQPLPLENGRLLNAGTALSGVMAGLYAPETWGMIAAGLAQAVEGDGSVLAALADSYVGRRPDGTYRTNSVEANTAINCVDYPADRDPATYGLMADEARAASPRFATLLAYSGLTCAAWPVDPDPVGRVRAAGSAPILVIGTTGDPAAPYAWSVRLADQLASARLLTHRGVGHTSVGIGDPCIDGAVAAYLVDLNLPGPGEAC